MTLNLDWSYVETTDEFIADQAMITDRIVKAVANKRVATPSSPFVYVISYLASMNRYFIRHMGDVKDIDQTPYLSLMQAEVGQGLPLTTDLPLVEFLREAKSWGGHKGTAAIYNFIANLVGSPLNINIPNDLVFRLSSNRSALSGALGGPRPFKTSKLARINDGKFWSLFTYQVDVLQAQDISNLTDLVNLLTSVHPAGSKMYLNFRYNETVDVPAISVLTSRETLADHFSVKTKYPTLDNGFKLSSAGRLSMHNGQFNLTALYDPTVDHQLIARAYRRFDLDTVTHNYLSDKAPNAAFSRFIDNHDGTYQQVFADNDATVYENVTTNVGISQYSWGDLKNLTWRELKSAAWNLDNANPPIEFFPQQMIMADNIA